ncbi:MULTISPECIES: AAA family ATPase [unclassified Chryseobacterium]|uniref:AAA family ATPase n=1 Tax=unclassified Chryseobacterium TaxID=2593645 RepID=UPI0028533F3A|nr:AAA family ATPase [Chryseobacterium sp. CFS7]MDR4890588.1 AAA family ATPase [Chryseobacterium sp. CFS7]
MKQNISTLYIITGGPGAGKTTLLDELNRHELTTVPEEGRKIIKEQIDSDGKGLPWLNKELFAVLMFEESVKTYLKISQMNSTAPVFFDRGILDTLGYMRLENIIIPASMEAKAREMVYHNPIFILPPWKEIYENDPERKQTFEKAVETFECMKEIYREYEYNIIEVPKVSVENRARFILDTIFISD